MRCQCNFCVHTQKKGSSSNNNNNDDHISNHPIPYYEGAYGTQTHDVAAAAR